MLPLKIQITKFKYLSIYFSMKYENLSCVGWILGKGFYILVQKVPGNFLKSHKKPTNLLVC
jgi:hypothetical protein